MDPMWAHMGPYGIIWDPYGPLWALMGPYGPIWAHMGPYGLIWAHGPIWALWYFNYSITGITSICHLIFSVGLWA